LYFTHYIFLFILFYDRNFRAVRAFNIFLISQFTVSLSTALSAVAHNVLQLGAGGGYDTVHAGY
jgi:hypothetical protein